MRLLKIEDACEDMRVVLAAPNPNYTICPNNPKVGTKWECEGTIDELGASIYVSWDNGTTNVYKNNELAEVESAGRCEVFW